MEKINSFCVKCFSDHILIKGMCFEKNPTLFQNCKTMAIKNDFIFGNCQICDVFSIPLDISGEYFCISDDLFHLYFNTPEIENCLYYSYDD